MDDGDFFRREKVLAKRVFAVAMMERIMFLDGHADKEMERVTLEDRHKFVQF
jgi:hypothetical protein